MHRACDPEADQGLSGPHRPTTPLTLDLDPVDLAALEAQATYLGIDASELAQRVISRRLQRMANELLADHSGFAWEQG